jgi:RNA polymerase sigma-70 factor (ECF subfamily)
MHHRPVVPDPATSAFSVRPVRVQTMSDEELMEQLRNGHPDALQMLFDRFYRLVLKIALKILRDPGEAEDVMQEIFLEIFNKADQFNPARGSPKTWILQYAYHRSLSRRQYLALRNFYHQGSELEIVESNRPDVSWEGLTFQEWRRVIQQGLASLNEKQRKTIEQACFDGLLLSEIAERTKESLPNVRHHYYRGLQALRKFLRLEPGSATTPRRLKKEANDVGS